MKNPRSRSRTRAGGALAATMGTAVALVVAPSTSAFAATETFFEEQATANWSVAHTCASGAVVDARLLVESTRDFESPDTEDAQPTVRVQYQAVCPDGTSFGWVGIIGDDRPLDEHATIESAPDLEGVHASGTGTVRDNLGVNHDVTFDVTWTGTGGLETEVTTFTGFRVLIHTEKERSATATGTVTFDGAVLVDGAANHRITPVITSEEDKSISPSN